jgi:hypothetical protein
MFDVFLTLIYQAYSLFKLSTCYIKWSKTEVDIVANFFFAIAIPTFYIIIFAI